MPSHIGVQYSDFMRVHAKCSEVLRFKTNQGRQLEPVVDDDGGTLHIRRAKASEAILRGR